MTARGKGQRREARSAELARLRNHLCARDGVIVTRLDHLARSTFGLLEIADRLRSLAPHVLVQAVPSLLGGPGLRLLQRRVGIGFATPIIRCLEFLT